MSILIYPLRSGSVEPKQFGADPFGVNDSKFGFEQMMLTITGTRQKVNVIPGDVYRLATATTLNGDPLQIYDFSGARLVVQAKVTFANTAAIWIIGGTWEFDASLDGVTALEFNECDNVWIDYAELVGAGGTSPIIDAIGNTDLRLHNTTLINVTISWPQVLVYSSVKEIANVTRTPDGGATFLEYGGAVTVEAMPVASVAALKALAPPVSGIQKRTLGYYAGNNRAPGKYWWNSTDTRADNGGTIFQPDSLPPQGRWNLLYGDEGVSCALFGTKGDNVQDDIVFLQAWSDWCIANDVKGTMPPGTYKITSPWLLMKRTGSTFSFFKGHFEGVAGLGWDGLVGGVNSPVVIAPTYNNTFGIGIQGLVGGVFENISLLGKNDLITTLGDIGDPDDYKNWAAIANFVDGSARDSRYSPYAGLVIDPFGTSTPPDGGYPGLSAYYDSSAIGSTFSSFRGLSVANFVAGILISAHDTNNAEDLYFENCRIRRCKSGFAQGQAQSRNTTWKNSYIFESYYCFDGLSYGDQQGYAPNIDGGNCSGKYVFNVNMPFGQPGVVARGLYAESIYSLGYLGQSSPSRVEPGVFEGCHFSLKSSGIHPDFHLSVSSPVAFRVCGFDFAFIGADADLTPFRLLVQDISGSVDFEACVFHLNDAYDEEEWWFAPSHGLPVGNPTQARLFFQNSRVTGDGVRGRTHAWISAQLHEAYESSINGHYAAPGCQINFSDGGQKGKLYFVHHDDVNMPLDLGTKTLTLSGTNTGKGTFTATDETILRVGDLVYIADDQSYESNTGAVNLVRAMIAAGVVIDISGTTITISGIPQNIGTGSYPLRSGYWPKLHQATTGDTNSSTSITNVNNPTAWKIGQKIRGIGIPSGAYITNIVSTTFTISKAATSTNAGIRLYDADIYVLTGSAV